MYDYINKYFDKKANYIDDISGTHHVCPTDAKIKSLLPTEQSLRQHIQVRRMSQYYYDIVNFRVHGTCMYWATVFFGSKLIGWLQVAVTCRGEPVSPATSLHNLVEQWLRGGSSQKLQASIGTSAKEFVMVLAYGRRKVSAQWVQGNNLPR